MSKTLNRRRFIAISAAVAGLSAIPPGVALANAHVHRWRGVAMGADAEMLLYHDDPIAAERLTNACLSEVHRLERIFSLYRDDSALSQLNANGELHNPPPELIDLLSRAHAVSESTGGAFDITVQSLWRLYQEHFTKGGNADGPSRAALNAALERVDYRTVVVQPDIISFSRSGVQITLNGIAQGYITDAVANVLKRAGAMNVLVNMGEIRGLGLRGDGEPWRVGLGKDDGNQITLSDKAVATSAGHGMVFPSSNIHHLFDPRSGRSASNWQQISVVARNATMADALSTAFSTLDETKILAIRKKIDVQVYAINKDGNTVTV